MIDEEDDEGGGNGTPEGNGNGAAESRGLLTMKSSDELGGTLRSRAMQAKLMRVNFVVNPNITMGGVQFRC